jgi:hypothetical protein
MTKCTKGDITINTPTQLLYSCRSLVRIFINYVSGVLSIHIRHRVADLCGSNSEILKCCEINIEHFTSLFVKRLFLISGLVTHDPTREHQLVVASSTGTGLCCCLYLPHREVRL